MGKHANAVRRSRAENRQAMNQASPQAQATNAVTDLFPVAKDHRPQVSVVLFRDFGDVYIDGLKVDTVNGQLESMQVNQLLHELERRTNAIRVVTHEHQDLSVL